MPKFSLIGPGYLGRSSNVNASRLINFYAEVNGQDSKNVTSLVGTPGLKLFTDTGRGPGRGAHVFNGLIYTVSGGNLYSINNAGVSSASLGTLNTSTGRVVMADNGLAPIGGNHLAIVDGVKLYVLDVSTNTFTSYALTAHTVCFLNGYFIIDIGGGQFAASRLSDGTTWNVLDQGTADASPDDLLAVYANHGQLTLLGEGTTELYYPDGSAYVHFAQESGGVLDFGIAARYSVVKASNTIFWLATQKNNADGEFVGFGMLNGYGLDIVSPPAINYQWSQYTTVADAFSFALTMEGHEFILLTFPTANSSWLYDMTTKLWAEISTYTDSPYAVGRHISNWCVSYTGKHYVGSYLDGKIYELSSKYYDDDGLPIASVRIATEPSDDLNRKFYHRLQLDAETGIENILVYYPQINTYTITHLVNELYLIFTPTYDYRYLPTGAPANETQVVTELAALINGRAGEIFSASLGGIAPHQTLILTAKNPQIPFEANSGEWITSSIVAATSNYLNPKAVLSWSDDGGHIYSNDHTAFLGKQGEYLTRVYWNRLGNSRNRTWRIMISDAIKKVLIAAHIDSSKGYN